MVLSTALFLSTISGFVLPGMSILLGSIFGAFAGFGSGALEPGEFMARVTNYITYLTLLGCASWLLNGAFFASWLWFGELQAKAAREKLFDSLIDKEIGWFEERKDGVSAMLSKGQTQIKEMQTAVSQPLGYAAQSIATAIASLGVALYHSWSLTLVILAAIPVCLGILAFLSARMQPHIDQQKSHLSRASKTASCAISSIETVKTFNGQSHERSAFAKAVRCAAKEYKSQARLNALQLGFARIFTLGMFVQGFWYGSKLVKEGNSGFTPADIMTTFWSCFMATQALESIMPQLMLLEKGRAASTGLQALLAREDGSCRNFGGYMPLSCNGEIEVKGARFSVSFTYQSRHSEPALTNTNLSIPAGKTTFIVGRSGSGKSTLGSLILNTYHPLSGDILIDGYPTQTLDPRWIKENVSLIQQQSTLFNETIFRNISFGRKDYENVTKEDVLDACKMAALGRTVTEFPHGLETVVGIGGKQLSGGELQRVALARDRLRDAAVLILDEALSSLDVSTRRLASDAVRKWRHGKTTIIITHDISEIGGDDFVYIMEQGTVVQQGYRRDLETRTGAFQFLIAASESSREHRGRACRPPELSLIPEFNTDFWTKSCSELKLSPTFGEPRVLYDGRQSLYGDSIHKSSSLLLSPECSVGDRRLSQVSTAVDELSPISNQFSFSPCRSSFSNDSEPPTPGLPEEKAMLPKPIVSVQDGELSLVQILLTVWPCLGRKSKALLMLGFTAALFHATATPVFSYALARLLGSILDTRLPESETRKWSLSIIGIATIDACNYYLMHYLLEACGQSWVDHHRIQSFTMVLDQPRAWFFDDRNNVSNIIDDIEKHAEEMRNLVARFAGYSFVGFALTVIGTTWSVVCSWRLTLVGLCVAPVMYAISRGMGWASDKYESKCNDSAQATGAILHEAITNITTVRNYNLELYFRKKYFGATNSGLKTGIRRSLYTGVWFGLADSAILFATALIFYYGALLVGRTQEDLKDVLSVFTLLLFSLSSANVIIGLIPQISNCKDAAHRVLRLSNLPTGSDEHEGDLPLPPTSGAISFHNVTFSYPTRPHIPILNRISLTILAGECVAIVGASGSGKSTLSALLQRLYAPTGGEITFSSLPLQTLSTPLLREQLAVVSQSPTLFDASIVENITYGLAPGVWSTDDVVRAAKMAGIHEFVTSLPEGYNTPLGDNGAGLSGGQAQRVAIARALVRKPRVLVLDECTSNLDAESARIVRESVVRLMLEEGGRTTVVIITHCVELMKVAQRISVIGEGKVLEEGVYAELLRKGGAFARLVEVGLR
ncbi:P-loop containing nucleoside triphosphate hydrolase protein [Wilcoxina mikolae CBS 423.85]|nr:P-loop containing nucleoside triphosphate hydrolase protein [Wilcoxina mikolae CBS 423.85]